MITNGRSIEVSGLLPFTEYTVVISAFTNNTKLLTGPPCEVETKTAVGGIAESAWCCTCTILVTEQPCTCFVSYSATCSQKTADCSERDTDRKYCCP